MFEWTLESSCDLETAIIDVSNSLSRGFECNGGDSRSYQRLLRNSEKLTSMLLTAEQQLQLATLAEGVSITISAATADHRIPFELLRINDQFLCERFAVGRCVSETWPDERNRSRSQSSLAAAVFVAELWELIGSDTERTIVERRLRQVAFDFPDSISRLTVYSAAEYPRGVSQDISQKDECLRVLESCRWFHFAGHAVETDGARHLMLGRPDSSTPTSAGNSQISARDLDQLPSLPEIVFLNACAALQLPSGDRETSGISLVSEFLRRGTKWLIGPVAPVLDSQTRHFVSAFYDAVVQGQKFGEAIRLARIEARRNLGPFNILPLTYVLYGDPSGSPFAAGRSQPAESRSASTPIVTPKDGSRSFLPCKCSQCGQIIETRHGIGRRTEEIPDSGILCRNCCRPGTSNLHSSPGNDQHLPTADLIRPDSEKSISTDHDPTIDAFIRHIDECLNRGFQWHDLMDGQIHQCQFHCVEDLLVKDQPEVRSRRSLSELDHSTTIAPWTRSATYQISDEYRHCLGTLKFLIARTHPQASSSAGIDSSNPAVHGTLSALDLQQILTSADCSNAATSQVTYVCSATGFDRELIHELAEDSVPSWYPSQQRVYLHDISSQKTHFRRQDMSAHAFASLLQRESTGRQFKQAVDWIESQIPLVTSVCCEEIVMKLGLEADAVAAAMRYVANQRSLRLDATEEFGLVLSDSHPGGNITRDAGAVPAKTLWRQFRMAISRSVAGMARFLGRFLPGGSP
jgi:CHAT domain-containing protein